MKAFIFPLLFLLQASAGRAQLWEEWFKQDETALRYSAEQIAALRTYASALRKGYNIVREGLHTIDRIKKEDFMQHLAYISGLSAVNPQVKNNMKAASLMSLEEDLVQSERQFVRWIKEATFLSSEEKVYGQQVSQQLVKAGYTIGEEFRKVSTDGTFAMDDASRLQRIELLHAQFTRIYHLFRELAGSFHSLEMMRGQGQKERGILKQWSLH